MRKLLTLVREKVNANLDCAQESSILDDLRHAPDFSPRVLDTPQLAPSERSECGIANLRKSIYSIKKQMSNNCMIQLQKIYKFN
ncbi:MAG: hypothetical protein KJ718_00290 [Nanoarchaeota archaeon]|nr:hypothetical protein [Nanoarchaeota archaeon]MBU1050979.1 hypothetical protein [Nanoarchaeota archaeon]MBU1988023.1 hypothetical protein [Nanoarchaeota archaeon]